MAPAFRDLRNLLRAGQTCLVHTQVGRSGAFETLSTSTGWSTRQTFANASTLPFESIKDQDSLQDAKSTDDKGKSTQDELPPPPPLRFVSSEQRIALAPPARRLPICFPNITLQMLRLPPEQLHQLRETGWLREVAFKTTPDVTKLEIAAYLESVYGMSVERVTTMNYLGRKRLVLSRAGKKLWFRDDDWKKAYVTFRPPPGLEHLLGAGKAAAGKLSEEEDGEPMEEEEEEHEPVIEKVRRAARAPRPAPKPLAWQREEADSKPQG